MFLKLAPVDRKNHVIMSRFIDFTRLLISRVFLLYKDRKFLFSPNNFFPKLLGNGDLHFFYFHPVWVVTSLKVM